MEKPSMEKVTGTFDYYYDKKTCEGKLLTRGIDIFVRKLDASYSPTRLLNLEHKHFVRPIFHNMEKNHLIYPAKGILLKDWLKSRPWVGREMIKTETPRDPPIYYYYIHLWCRELLRAMLEFLYDIHMSRNSMQCKADNVMVYDGKVKFFGIDLDNVTSDRRVSDFAAMSELIVELFPNHGGLLNHLLGVLKSLRGFQSRDGYIITKHLSILPPHEVIQFVVRCGERIKRLKMGTMYYQVLNQIDGCEWEHWGRLFEEDDHSWFRKKFKITAENFIFQRQYNKEHNDHNKSLLKCARQIAVHYKDKDTAVDTGKLDLKAECMTLYFFRKPLYDLQVCMDNSHLLRLYMDSEIENPAVAKAHAAKMSALMAQKAKMSVEDAKMSAVTAQAAKMSAEDEENVS